MRIVKEPNKEKRKMIQLEVEKLLHKFNCYSNSVNYFYLVEGLVIICENPFSLRAICKEIYPEIVTRVKKYNSTKCSTVIGVERGLRRYIDKVWKDERNAQIISDIFIQCEKDKSPTNKEFLSILYDYMRLGGILDEIDNKIIVENESALA